MIKMKLYNGSRKDFYLICFKDNGFYKAIYTQQKGGFFEGLACQYKRLHNIVNFAKKHHFSLMLELEK